MLDDEALDNWIGGVRGFAVRNGYGSTTASSAALSRIRRAEVRLVVGQLGGRELRERVPDADCGIFSQLVTRLARDGDERGEDLSHADLATQVRSPSRVHVMITLSPSVRIHHTPESSIRIVAAA